MALLALFRFTQSNMAAGGLTGAYIANKTFWKDRDSYNVFTKPGPVGIPDVYMSSLYTILGVCSGISLGLAWPYTYYKIYQNREEYLELVKLEWPGNYVPQA